MKIRDLVETVYYRSLHPLGNIRQGQNIFESNWDVCVILDACRADLLEEVADEYSFLSEPTRKVSVDSKTDAWVRKTFSQANTHCLNKVSYVTANPFSREIPDESTLQSINHVWKYGWDDELGTVPPRVVTDRAISAFRDRNPESMLIHYLQPHVPFIPWEQNTPLERGNFGLNESGVNDTWQRLRDSKISAADVWHGYRKNLRHVLDEINLLLNNIDANRVIITSDHGNGIGEWGIYGHPIHMPFNCVRVVPWVTTEANDHERHRPKDHQTQSEVDITEKLSALGYVE